MIEGLQAVRLGVPDLPLAVAWYSRALDVEPCVSDASSATFFLDGSLLRLEHAPRMPDDIGVPCATVYWRVDHLQSELQRLHAVNAAPFEAVAQLNADTHIASVLDPFGNVLGLIERRDPAIPEARIQRVAEKVAIRNVRETLDGLAEEEAKKRRALKTALAWSAAGAALAALLVWDMVRR